MILASFEYIFKEIKILSYAVLSKYQKCRGCSLCVPKSNPLGPWLSSHAAVFTTIENVFLVQLQSFLSLPWQKEERTMLEDTKAALLDLDKVTVFFRQLEDECLVASKKLHQQRLTRLIQTRLLVMSSCMV